MAEADAGVIAKLRAKDLAEIFVRFAAAAPDAPLPAVARFASLRRLDHGLATYPLGRRGIRQCRLAHPKPAMRHEISKPAAWRVGTNTVLTNWVGSLSATVRKPPR